jgi:hypothetical protein
MVQVTMIVTPGLVPGIHGNCESLWRQSWMAGTSPAMTVG